MTGGPTPQFLSRLLRSIGEKNPTGRILAYCYAHALMADPSLEKQIFGTNSRYRTTARFDTHQWDVTADKFIFDGPITGKNRRADICISYNKKPEIAAALRKRKDNEIAQMIAQYLEDQKMGGYQPLDAQESHLLYFTRRLLPMGHEGYANKDSSYKLTQIMEQCLNNARNIGEWLIAGNEDKLTLSVYPWVDAYWDVKQLVNKCNKDHGHVDELSGYIADYFKSGYIYFVAQVRSGTTPPVWLSVSFWFGIDEEDRLYQGLIVEIEGRELEDVEDRHSKTERTKSLIGYSEKNLRKDIFELIKKTQEKVRESTQSQTVQHIVEMRFPGLE